MENKIITKDGKLYTEVSNNLFSYFNELDIPEGNPKLSWNVGQFSWDMWDDIKNICAYTYEKHKSECMVRLYYNESLNEWKAVLFPQTMNGMTVKDELCSKTLIEEDCTNGWVEAGSLHHHCASGAFQSGTDEKDEAQQIGLHMTLGKMNANQYEIHSRFKTLDGFKDVNLMSFFESPDWLDAVPDKYKNALLYNVLVDRALSPGNPDNARQDWISRIKEKPKATVTPYNRYNPNGQHFFNYGNQYDLDTASEGFFRARKEVEEREEFYQDVYLDLCVPLDSETDPQPTMTADDVLSLIDNTKKTAEDNNHGDMWDVIREAIKDGRKTIKTVTLTGFRKYISENKEELELAVQTAIEDDLNEEPGQADEMGETNNQISII